MGRKVFLCPICAEEVFPMIIGDDYNSGVWNWEKDLFHVHEWECPDCKWIWTDDTVRAFTHDHN